MPDPNIPETFDFVCTQCGNVTQVSTPPTSDGAEPDSFLCSAQCFCDMLDALVNHDDNTVTTEEALENFIDQVNNLTPAEAQTIQMAQSSTDIEELTRASHETGIAIIESKDFNLTALIINALLRITTARMPTVTFENQHIVKPVLAQAARGLIARHLLDQPTYLTMTRVAREAGLTVHPNDLELTSTPTD